MKTRTIDQWNKIYLRRCNWWIFWSKFFTIIRGKHTAKYCKDRAKEYWNYYLNN